MKAGLLTRSIRILGLSIALMLVLAVVVLNVQDDNRIIESAALLTVLNAIFITAISFFTAAISLIAYLRAGLVRFLALSAGAIAFGSTALISPLMQSYGPNTMVTIYNSGILLVAICYAIGITNFGTISLSGKVPARRVVIGTLSILLVIFLIAVISLLSIQGKLPWFFIQGVGSTPLRQVILGLAIVLFGGTAIYVFRDYLETRTGFNYWYALGMFCIATGFIAVYVTSSLGNPLNWAGRIGQYIGNVYLLVAALTAIRTVHSRSMAVEDMVATLFQEPGFNYRLIMETDPNGIVVLNHQGRIITWNRGAERLFGYTSDEAIGSSLAELILPNHTEYVEKSLRVLQADDGKKIDKATADLTARSKDGVALPVNLSISGKKTNLGWTSLAILSDITERKEAEQKIRVSEEKYRSLFDNMTEAFLLGEVILNENNAVNDIRFLEVNQAFERLININREKLTGKTFSEVFPRGNNLYFNKILGSVAVTEVTSTTQIFDTFLKKWIQIYAYSPGKGRFAAIISDISENKRAEESLKITNDRMKILSDASSLLLSSENPEKIMQTIASNVMLHLGCDCFFNYMADEKAGKLRLNAYAGIPEEVAKGIAWLDYGVAICGCAARDGCRIISENVQENGDMRATLVRSFGIQAYVCHPLKVGVETIGTLSFGTRSRTSFTGDEIDLMRAVASQISVAMNRKRTEDYLKHYAAQLETANKELEAFSYSVSHDLRTPLRTLDSFSEAVELEYGDKLDNTARDYLQRVRKASQTMSQLIDDMLKLARITRMEMHQEITDLSEMAKSIIDDLKKTQPERQVDIIIAPGIIVQADKNLMEIGLKNLLENAWKFSGKRLQTRIEFGTLDRKGEKIYYIKDNGAGFDMQFANKLFQPFERLHARTDYPGSGIGLATVQRIIQRHGGKIWAESEVGQGATFFFTLGQGTGWK